MTEAEWLASTGPAAMLRHLEAVRIYGQSRTDPGSPVSDRKLRLFAYACCEGSDCIAFHNKGWEEVRVMAAVHHGLAHATPLKAAALLRCLFGNPWRPVELPGPPCPDCDEGAPDENCDDCGGSGTVLGPCPWVTPTVTALARHAYDERDWSTLGPLSDALEQAGCDVATLFDHLRGPGPHARGCWALDLLLAKEQTSWRASRTSSKP